MSLSVHEIAKRFGATVSTKKVRQQRKKTQEEVPEFMHTQLRHVVRAQQQQQQSAKLSDDKYPHSFNMSSFHQSESRSREEIMINNTPNAINKNSQPSHLSNSNRATSTISKVGTLAASVKSSGQNASSSQHDNDEFDDCRSSGATKECSQCETHCDDWIAIDEMQFYHDDDGDEDSSSSSSEEEDENVFRPAMPIKLDLAILGCGKITYKYEKRGKENAQDPLRANSQYSETPSLDTDDTFCEDEEEIQFDWQNQNEIESNDTEQLAMKPSQQYVDVEAVDASIGPLSEDEDEKDHDDDGYTDQDSENDTEQASDNDTEQDSDDETEEDSDDEEEQLLLSTLFDEFGLKDKQSRPLLRFYREEYGIVLVEQLFDREPRDIIDPVNLGRYLTVQEQRGLVTMARHIVNVEMIGKQWSGQYLKQWINAFNRQTVFLAGSVEENDNDIEEANDEVEEIKAWIWSSSN